MNNDDTNNDLSGEFVLNKTEPQPPANTEMQQIEEVLNQEDVAQGIKKNNANFLSSLCLFPKNIHFENQEKDEQVVLIVRRALITNIPWLLTALLLVFFPLIAFLSSDLITPFIDLSAQTIFVILLFYYLMIFGFVLVEFTIWYFNVGLITNVRVVDLDLHGILHKHVSETRLNLIEDVSYSRVGSVRSVFNYGDVFIQTAGNKANFEFMRSPQPAKIVRIIADMIGGKMKWK